MTNPDSEWLKACKEGDRLAQSRLYKHCFAVLMRVARRYSGNDQDTVEVVNHSFLKILTNLSSWPPGAPFEAWVRRIAIHTAIDAFRKVRRRREWESEYPPEDMEPAPWRPDAAQERISAEQLEAMMQKLPEMTRQVFNLFAVDGYHHKEIADMIGISESTSRWHVADARKRMKEMIAALIQKERTT